MGDFNGDGQVELMNYGYNCYNSSDANRDPVWRLYPNSSYNTDKGKVTSVTGDYGSVTNITYTPLSMAVSIPKVRVAVILLPIILCLCM